jgi:hypothetical protein
MARYAGGTNKAGVNTANTQMFMIRAGAGQSTFLLELAVSVAVSPTTGPSWRLNRPTAAGTASTQVTPQTEEPDAIAALTRIDTAWSAAPTAATTDMRVYATPNAIGSGIVWTWYDRPLRIPAATGLILINANAAGATLGSFNFYALVQE